MSYKSFYRYISKKKNIFIIRKDGEYFGSYKNVEDALYERDRLIQVDWDVDLWVGLAETNNAYYQITLPPFEHTSTYISEEKECWVVRDKGRNQTYRGRYSSLEEAKKVALIYNANVSHKNKGYCVRRHLNGKNRYFGRYKTREEAENRVKELEKNGWTK